MSVYVYLLGMKHSFWRTHVVTGLKEHRILGATAQRDYMQCSKAKLQLTLVRAETHGSTDWTFPLLKGSCGDSKRKFSMPDRTKTTGYRNGSIMCSWNGSCSQPASNPLLPFSCTPSCLYMRSRLSNLSPV